MNTIEILKRLRRTPFRPLRFHLSDGSHYDVYHPEMALVTKTEVVIAMETEPGEVPDHSVLCDPLHITRIEELRPASRKKS